MLQQTRVAAVIPFYHRFLQRFPDIAALAAASEPHLLACWSGLGYYSRARNLQKSAQRMNGVFPHDYESIRALAGVGDYTAAAVGSIAFGLPYAVLDGNVMRVLSRLSNDSGDIGSPATRRRLQELADRLLDRGQPGKFNQAVMELGATLCVPVQPQCLLCPVAQFCKAREQGTQNQLPVKLKKIASVKLERILLLIRKNGAILLWRRPADSRKLAGFWELPEPHLLASAVVGEEIGDFRHSITNHNYVFRVRSAEVQDHPEGFDWLQADELEKRPLSTTVRKALAFCNGDESVQGP